MKVIGSASWTKGVLAQASQIADPIERERFLAEVCGDRQDCLKELLQWFDGQESSVSPLDVAVSQLHRTPGRYDIRQNPLLPDEAKTPNATEDETPAPTTQLDEFLCTLDWSAGFDPEKLCGLKVGPYELIKVLGRGGMGVVYEAHQREPVSRSVAIKLIDFEISSQFSRAYFEAERKTLELMNHPGITGLLDAGVTAWGTPYYVMELVRGVPIHRYCEQKVLPLESRLRLFMDLCFAVQHAHQKGIVHRDLKPSNVLVTEWDNKPVVKLIDFGIALNTETGSSQLNEKITTKLMAGTPLYMSPEQATGDVASIDTRSDVYSLGVILFRLITHTTPIDQEELLDKSQSEIQSLILNMPAILPSEKVYAQDPEFAETLRFELDWIVSKAMAKSPTDRYLTPFAISEDVEAFLLGQVVRARPSSWQYLCYKRIAANRGLFVSAAVSFLILAAATVVSLVYMLEARRAQSVSRRLLVNADMKLASDAYKEGNFRLARERLERHLPTLESNFRESFAWRYLWKRVRPELSTVDCDTPIFNVSCHPHDGEYITSHDAGDLQVRRFDTPDAHRSLKVDERTIRSARYSPTGEFIATGNVDGVLRIWDSESDKLLVSFDASEGGDIYCLEWINEDQVAVAGDVFVTVWDVPKLIKSQNASRSTFDADEHGLSARCQECLVAQVGPFPGYVHGIAVAPHGRHIAVASTNESAVGAGGMVTIWDVTHWNKINTIGTSSKVISVAYHPDVSRSKSQLPEGFPHAYLHCDLLVAGMQSGHFIATYAAEITEGVFHNQTLIRMGHTSNIYDVSFSKNGDYVVSVSKDATARIWETADWNCLQTIQCHTSRIYDSSFISNTSMFVTAGADGKVRTFDASRLPHRKVAIEHVHAESLDSRATDNYNSSNPQRVLGTEPFSNEGDFLFWGTMSDSGILSNRTRKFSRLPFWEIEHASCSENGRIALANRDGAIYRVTSHGIERLEYDGGEIDMDFDGQVDPVCGFGEEGYLVFQPSQGTDRSPRLADVDRLIRRTIYPLKTKDADCDFQFLVMERGFGDMVVASYRNNRQVRREFQKEELSTDSVWHCRSLRDGDKFVRFLTNSRSDVVSYFSTMESSSKKLLMLQEGGVKNIKSIDMEGDGSIDYVAVLLESDYVDIYDFESEEMLVFKQRIRVPPKAISMDVVVEDRGIQLYVGTTYGIFYSSWLGDRFSEDILQVQTLDDRSWHRPIPASVIVYDYDKDEIVNRYFFPAAPSISMALSEDGLTFAGASLGKEIRYGKVDGQLDKSFATARDSKSGMALTANGERLCVAVGDDVWFINPIKSQLINIGKNHDNAVCCCKLSPTGKYLATGSNDLSIQVWDPVKGTQVRSLVGHRTAPVWLAFSEDEQWLASADTGGVIKIWDLQTGGELLELTDFAGFVRGLAFSKDDHGEDSLIAIGSISEVGDQDFFIHEWSVWE